MIEIRTVDVLKYVVPLREGGSLPAIVDADDGFSYVLKFRGAGQGIKALVAELLGGEIARALGLKVPEIVFANVDAAFGRTEPDAEIQDLLKASVGLNLALHYLDRAITYDPAVMKMDGLSASKIVWLDALLKNMDRTAYNANLLIWRKELWLIDHGACLYFHHNWGTWKKNIQAPFPMIKDHILLSAADQLEKADELCRSLLTKKKLLEIVHLIPDEWLLLYDADYTPEQVKAVYMEYIWERIQTSSNFLNEAIDARNAIV